MKSEYEIIAELAQNGEIKYDLWLDRGDLLLEFFTKLFDYIDELIRDFKGPVLVSKDDLARLIHSFLERYCSDKLTLLVSDKLSTDKQLVALIHAHIYLSELMQPWFYFAYMETKNLAKSFKGAAILSELKMEDKIYHLIRAHGSLPDEKAQLTSSLVKAMLQDWYLKRWKYKKRKINVDKYAEQVVDILLTYINRT